MKRTAEVAVRDAGARKQQQKTPVVHGVQHEHQHNELQIGCHPHLEPEGL